MWNDPNSIDNQDYSYEPPAPQPAEKPASSSGGGLKEPILGMTPAQRFVVALFLIAVVCLLGVMALVVFGKVVFY